MCDRERVRHDGVPFTRDPRLAGVLAPLIEQDRSIGPGLNDPYAVSDAADSTSPVPAETPGIVPVETEIRQVLIETAEA
jgi:predicted N-formylglutamate amidohydrolase